MNLRDRAIREHADEATAHLRHLEALLEGQALHTITTEDDKCQECGEHTNELVLCPDGAEVCQNCFDQGAH